jgi:branched-chain amino acid transport system permease protein
MMGSHRESQQGFKKMIVSRNRFLTILSVLTLLAFLFYADRNLDSYTVRILENIAIFITLAVSYNLINGIMGQFSLAPNAFLAIGAYTSAIFTLSPEEKLRSFIIEPMLWPLSVVSFPFAISLLFAGIATALVAVMMATPVFRVRGDYLAIVTLGFGEVIQVLANNFLSITNGSLGLKGLYPYTNLWWAWGFCIFTIFCTVRLINSSYGRAMKAVREDEIAAEAMGINALRIKTFAFAFSAFFQGVAGGLLAHLITTISPSLFTFMFTFNLLIIVVIGGLGSTTGSVLAAILITWGGEALRVFEEPSNFFGFQYEGIPGMRMVLFSVILIMVMLFARSGIMGRSEFSWEGLFQWFRRKFSALKV